MVTPYVYTTINGLEAKGAEVQVIVGSAGAAGVILPCSRFSMDYGVNAIPNATAMVALGRDARTGKDSAVYGTISQIKQMAPCRIQLVGDLNEYTPVTSWPVPDEPAILFQGYVSGFTYRRTTGRVSLVINMVHRLHDLNCSSTGSSLLVPGAPHDLLRPTLVESTGGDISANAAGTYTNELQKDLDFDFSFGVLNVLMQLARDNQIQTGNKDLWCGASAPGNLSNEADNTRVIKTIEGDGIQWKGIENYASGSEVVSNTLTPKEQEDLQNVRRIIKDVIERKKMQYPLKVEANVLRAAADFIGESLHASRAGSSFWQVLISSILPSFGAAIIPINDRAFLAPILQMNKKHDKQILPTEYADFNLKAMSKRPLYGVGVMAKYNYATVADGDNKRCIGETFIAQASQGGGPPDGMWLFVNAPRWMDDWTSSDPFVAEGGDPDVLKLLAKPSHDATGVQTATVNRNIDGEVDQFNDAMAKYAQMVYISNALAGRTGTIQGKLRFDICPGMTVRIESKGDRQFTSPGVDQLAEPLFAFIARVSVFIDAEQRSAGTTFEITNVRGETENSEGDRYSMSEHPFFEDKFFKGASLVKPLDRGVLSRRPAISDPLNPGI
jgi:hypothetical protein